jgi:uncharacterized protein YjiS (DUF1127 family)
MEFPNGSRQTSRYQHYIRAAHKARSAEVYRLLAKAGRGFATAGRWLVAPLARTVRGLVKERQLRSAMRELHAMDDRLLADMGLRREDIDDAVRSGRNMPDIAREQRHPHEAKQAAKVVELRREPDLMGALILHGPWGRYSEPGRKRNDAA